MENKLKYKLEMLEKQLIKMIEELDYPQAGVHKVIADVFKEELKTSKETNE